LTADLPVDRVLRVVLTAAPGIILGAMKRTGRRLSSQIFAFQAGILLVCGLIGAALAVHGVQKRLDGDYEQRALAVARSVAADPDVAAAVAAADRSGTVQRRAEAVRRATRTSFVVVTDVRGIRFSHPVPARIGERVSTDPSEALAGRTVTVVETGTLGRSARAKVPLRDASGRIVGVVSVGILESTIRHDLRDALPVVALYAGIALAIGLLASSLLARRLKRATFGLELDEIASLVQEREAMLHGIREGVVATDREGRVRVVNDEGKRLLGVGDEVLGTPAAQLVGDERLADLLAGRLSGRDLIVVRGERVLVANRMPVALDGRDLGAVVTLRDRTELESAVRELDDVRSLSDALRAQAHEFFNRLHTVSGLLQLGHTDEAVDFVQEITAGDAELRRDLAARLDDPLLSALLLAKSAVAGERGVELRLGPDTRQEGELRDGRAVLTVVGNLIDNALDAAQGGQEAWVEVTLRTEGHELAIAVADSGPGVAPEARDRVFEDGFTTKPASGPGARGVGLSLVARVVERRGGRVAVGAAPGGGALFEAQLPDAVRDVAEVAP
jgi:two-component system CitB family sensor kinase